MQYDEKEPPPQALRNLVRDISIKGSKMVIGCDANGHHVQWGSKDINERGESKLSKLVKEKLGTWADSQASGNPTHDDIENSVKRLEEALEEGYREACPVRYSRKTGMRN